MKKAAGRIHVSFVATLGILGCSALVPVRAQVSDAGRIVGHIDGVFVDDGGAHVRGWACQALTELEVPARAAFVKSSGSLEPPWFGKWRKWVGSVPLAEPTVRY